MSTPHVQYSPDELVAAYLEWVDAGKSLRLDDPLMVNSTMYLRRQDTWESYCDVRDKLPRGTTQARRVAGPYAAPLRLVSCRATIPPVDSGP